MKRYCLLITIFVLLFSFGISNADQAMKESEYRTQMSMEAFPETITVNVPTDCGDYQIRVLGQPLVTVSTSGLHAYDDKSYLILRVGIKNNSENPVIWLDPESFQVQEYYLNIYGISYELNHYMSAKAAQAYNLPAYYSVIKPEQELSTMLVFEVYGNVDGWVFTFSPFTREMDEAEDSVSFVLPKFTKQ